MRRFFVLFFAAASGYISLSQEMLWMRVVSYMTGGRPIVFACILGFFLAGVARGALFAERLCERRLAEDDASAVRFIGTMLIISGIFYYLSISMAAQIYARSVVLGVMATNITVAVVSFLLGGIFPVLCHYGTRAGQDVGLAISRVYLANIIGSTLGPLLTGFVIMQYIATDRIVLYLSAATLALGIMALLADSRYQRSWYVPASVIGLALMFVVHPWIYNRLLEKIQLNGYSVRPAEKHYKYLVQNRSGIIAVDESPGGDIIWGGGVYDGRFNIDPVIDSNGIKRAFMIAALHPNPEEVLCIGLASGSWVRVVADYPLVKKVVVVEINPGYLEVIQKYPQQASILTDPRLTIEIDDGRRWLNRHPAAKFDFILQNTTYHWRDHSTNLLSAEYFHLCKKHLKPGGVVYCNATGSEDVAYTMAGVFNHVVRYKSFVAGSDSSFALTPDQIRTNLLNFRSGGKPFFAPDNQTLQSVVTELAALDLSDKAPGLREQHGLHMITDDNMATEYKLDRWYDSEHTWRSFLRRRSQQ